MSLEFTVADYIKQHNLEKYFVILGIVPFKDLCSLMYHSISVLNPSKSEGWGNSASQAALLEKKAIISNIPVHREQLNRNFIYFHPENYKQLAKILDNNSRKKTISKLVNKNLSYNRLLNEKKYIENYLNVILS